MAIDASTFLAEYPEFSGVAPQAVVRRITQALATLNRGKLGIYYEDAVYLWTAHYLFLRFDIGAGLDENGMQSQENEGVITSQSANTTGLSSSSSVSALTSSDNPVEADFSRTKYGMEYLSLLRQTVAPMALCS